MPILPGRRLGPYEILSAIGAGGMGEVYKARDTRLDRIVAIKVLPTHLADRSELRERFEREAKTIASLNHPHICTLYDTGNQDDIDYLVMEYIEGETLAQRLHKGALPIQQVLQYAIEISDALDKAHRKGITHRDLKPGNIMLTKTGTKLLDFGLAKLQQEATPAAPLSQLPTLAEPVTAQGTILGTLQYMAPEQVEGKTDRIDARTDIFAFGAVVYEMATGKKAFVGDSQASLIAAILEREPRAISSLQPMAPPELDRVVKRCLAKDPEDRWQSTRDVADELKWISQSGSQVSSPSRDQAKGLHVLGRRPLVFSLGGLLLGLMIASFATWSLQPTRLQPVTRLVVDVPPGQQLAGLDSGPALVLSPDGTKLAYIARQRGTQQIYLKAMDSLEAKSIPGTEGAVNPFFSPDNQWLGFFADGKLKKASVRGGGAIFLGDAANPFGASWGNQGTIVFGPSTVGILQQVPANGGTSQPLTHFEKQEIVHGWPEFLPGGKTLLFAASDNNGYWTNAQIMVQTVATGERRKLIQAGMNPHYAASGHLLFVQGGSMMAAPFDLQRLAVTGAAVPVVDGILQSVTSGYAQYSISGTGSLVYVPGSVQSTERRMVWVDRKGVEQAVPAPARPYRYARISPDGQRAAVIIEAPESQIWLYDLRREALTQWTFEGNINVMGAWTPDGKRIAFMSNREGPGNTYWQLADGGGGLERLSSSENNQVPTSWSPDGRELAFIKIRPDTGYDIWVLRVSDHEARPFLQSRFNESAPQFSPDGHWLVYVSDESGRFEVYVQPYPGPGGKWQVSTDGGTEPVWNRNGRELFYRQGDKMMAVDVTTQSGFSAGKPKMLFEGAYQLTPVTFPNYDVSPDGQRFLMLKPSEQEQAPTRIDVVLNWFEELKQKVPAGK